MRETQRTLIYIPITHTEDDMGSLGRRLPGYGDYRRLAEARWAEVRRQVQTLPLDWPKVKVYQDGLPNAGPDIIRKILVEVQSPNYDLLRWLVAQGAELVGTESPALISEEYNHLLAIHATKNMAAKAKARQAYAQRANVLLAERDAYIAQRVAETLPAGRIGILFVGQAHHVSKHLVIDIVVEGLPGDSADKRSSTT